MYVPRMGSILSSVLTQWGATLVIKLKKHPVLNLKQAELSV